MIQHGGRFRMTATKLTPSYKIHMELRITGVRGSDFGAYRCIAKNPRGETDGEITLTEEIVPTTTSLSTKPTTTSFHTSTTKTQTTKYLSSTTSIVVDIVPKGHNNRRRSKEHAYGSSVNDLGERRKNGRKERKQKHKQNDISG